MLQVGCEKVYASDLRGDHVPWSLIPYTTLVGLHEPLNNKTPGGVPHRALDFQSCQPLL